MSPAPVAMVWHMASAAVALPKFAGWSVDVTNTVLKPPGVGVVLGVEVAPGGPLVAVGPGVAGVGVAVGVGVGVEVDGAAALHSAGYVGTNAGTAASLAQSTANSVTQSTQSTRSPSASTA